MIGVDRRNGGWVRIGISEVVIGVGAKGNYWTCSNRGRDILQITEDGDGINAITKEKKGDYAKVNMLEVYA